MALAIEKTSNLAAMHTLVLFFGIGAWVAINGVWVELPVLISNPEKPLPEGWGLPAFLVALNQVANIGPLVAALIKGFLPKYYNLNALIYIMLSLGSVSSLLLCFLWDKTVFISGTEHSLAFFVLFLILAFVDCTSSLTFLPFVSRFSEVFVTTYFVGEGLSGFLPSVVALAQGASQSHCMNASYINETTNETQYKIETQYTEPRFSVGWFFGFLCLMMLACTTSFVLLNHSATARSFRTDKKDQDRSPDDSFHLSPSEQPAGTGFYTKGKNVTENPDEPDSSQVPLSATKPTEAKLTRNQYIYFYLLVAWISGISNGAMPSVISYSSLPYGQLPYHFAATLSAMANPVACFLSLYLAVKSHSLVALLTVAMTACACYLMVLAVGSPCPVLVGSVAGESLMVLVQIAFVFAASYAKVSIGQILRTRGNPHSLVWYGAFTQLGALIGAMVMFPLVNVYHFFTSGDPCLTVC